jgi:HD-GYP domain-containing protein (c-di-GMP phosphodiesterase class II)
MSADRILAGALTEPFRAGTTIGAALAALCRLPPLVAFRRLLELMEEADPECHAHMLRVGRTSCQIGMELGLDGDELSCVWTAGILHDVGRLALLCSSVGGGPPVIGGWRSRDHSVIGYELLAGIDFPWPVAAAVRHHHERFDGTGYPDGRAAGDIPAGSRIVAVADAVDLLDIGGPCGAPVQFPEILVHLMDGRGTTFDPVVVEAFLGLVTRNSFEQHRW